METRKEFLKKAALLSGGVGLFSSLPPSIQKALAINPELGSTFLDAEHVVILMQENRSFDHCYGSLQGVRGFNDPRAMTLPDGKPVWLQTNAEGETYAPFRLDMKGTNATWMGSLPHSWANQVDARNNGRYDKWLHAKKSRRYPAMPLSMGYYNRKDIPFYYSFADAFTICDQNFCSSLTGTHANRLYLMTGTIREKQGASSQALVLNGNADFNHEVNWTTFPERLEDHGVSWKVYQNELGVETGFDKNEYAWLSNLHCNMLEVFSRFKVRFSPSARAYLEKMAKTLPDEISQLEKQGQSEETKRLLAKKKKDLESIIKQCDIYTQENWDRLSEREKSIHNRAFCTNAGDPDYRKLETITYQEGDKERKVEVPKGDIYHQFREDVKNGTLPTVSWIVGPQNFSDHPASPWYGAWYVSEAIDILTQNPEVWKKTIFILAYDENDGYFDHVPPFVAPHPNKPETGATSKNIDTSVDFIALEMDKKNKPLSGARESAIGLGYRVPLVVASPWSRGGCVCSEVFDHTSILQFLEKFLSHKTGKKIEEPQISSWRRTVCGDLSSVFQPYNGEKFEIPFPGRNEFVEEIHRARFKKTPSGFRKLLSTEINEIKSNPGSPLIPAQEKGKRRSCPLPYQLYADGAVQANGETLNIRLAAGNEIFGNRSAGAPFNVYAYRGDGKMDVRNYAVSAGDGIEDFWKLKEFDNGIYNVKVDGPNGFMRVFKGQPGDPLIDTRLEYSGTNKKLSGNLEVTIVNHSRQVTIVIKDNAYGQTGQDKIIEAGRRATLTINAQQSFGWYDFSILLEGVSGFERRCAGRVETGKWGYTDPAMAGNDS